MQDRKRKTGTLQETLIILILLSGIQSCSSGDVVYKISSAGMQIKTKIHSQSIPVDSLNIESIRIIDLKDEISYQPCLRLWGISQTEITTEILQTEDYHEGWFLLNNDETALIFVSEHNQVVYIQTRMLPPRKVQIAAEMKTSEETEKDKFYSILLGTENPELMIELMKREWDQAESDK